MTTDETSRNRGNIKVDREFKQRHNQRRKELGLTWQEYIDGQAPDFDDIAPDEREIATMVVDDLLSQLPTRISDELQR